MSLENLVLRSELADDRFELLLNKSCHFCFNYLR